MVSSLLQDLRPSSGLGEQEIRRLPVAHQYIMVVETAELNYDN